MEGSGGLIIAFIVALWAAYFVPLALRRYDEASNNETVDASAARKTVTAVKAPARRVAPVVTPKVASTAPAPTRAAAQIAARRRRNTLLTLIAALAAVAGSAASGLIGWWWVAAPVFLIAAWLVACRIMVRGELGMQTMRLPRLSHGRSARVIEEELTEEISLEEIGEYRANETQRDSRVGALWASTKSKMASLGSVAGKLIAKPVNPVEGIDTEATIVVTDQLEEYDPDVRHVMEKDVPLEADALDEQLQIAVPSASVTSGEALWDPLPVTVPSYVTKPRAGRTVRTIDFSQPGTWTSGHVEGEQTELPGMNAEGDEGTGTHRKAVGH